MQVDVPYPKLAAERQILLETTGVAERTAAASSMRTVWPKSRAHPQDAGRRNRVDAILNLVRAARPGHGTRSPIATSPGAPARAPVRP